MENTAKWSSPKSPIGSFGLSILTHAGVFGIGILVLALGFKNRQLAAPITEEIAYETFSEPPAPAEIPRHVMRQPEPETPVKPDVHPDTNPKELQDTQSTVAGTQKAAPVQAAPIGSEGTGDANATPYYKIKPKYPRAALASGVEGYILMKIDVNEKGEVENVRIIGGQERGMFQDEARRAVEKWKYKPFMNASGQPVKKTDHEVRVDFKLQDA